MTSSPRRTNPPQWNRWGNNSNNSSPASTLNRNGGRNYQRHPAATPKKYTVFPRDWMHGFIYNLSDRGGFVYSISLEEDVYFESSILPRAFPMGTLLPGMATRVKAYRERCGYGKSRYKATNIDFLSGRSKDVVEGVGMVHSTTADKYAVVQTHGGSEEMSNTESCLPVWSHPAHELPDVATKIHFMAVPKNLKLQEESVDDNLIFWWHEQREDCTASFHQHFDHFRKVMYEEASKFSDTPGSGNTEGTPALVVGQAEGHGNPRSLLTERRRSENIQLTNEIQSGTQAITNTATSEEEILVSPTTQPSVTGPEIPASIAQAIPNFGSVCTTTSMESPSISTTAMEDLADFLGIPVEELQKTSRLDARLASVSMDILCGEEAFAVTKDATRQNGLAESNTGSKHPSTKRIGPLSNWDEVSIGLDSVATEETNFSIIEERKNASGVLREVGENGGIEGKEPARSNAASGSQTEKGSKAENGYGISTEAKAENTNHGSEFLDEISNFFAVPKTTVSDNNGVWNLQGLTHQATDQTKIVMSKEVQEEQTEMTEKEEEAMFFKLARAEARRAFDRARGALLPAVHNRLTDVECAEIYGWCVGPMNAPPPERSVVGREMRILERNGLLLL